MNNLKNLALSFTLATLMVGGAVAQNMPNMAGKEPTISAMAKADAMTTAFKGIEVNGGMVDLYNVDGKHVLRLTPDFKIPKTPAPTWQIVDGMGNTFLLKQLKIAGDKTNRQVVLPSYIKSVAKVQIYCTFAEVVLGEAKFDQTIELN